MSLRFHARLILSINLVLLMIYTSVEENKYSAEANRSKYADSSQPISLRDLDKPFRMAKLNVVWAKAKNVSLLDFIKIKVLEIHYT